VQAAGLAPAVPWLTEAGKLVPLGQPYLPLIVADYGSSQGRNSLGPLGAAIGVLRERADADRPISVVHTDLPGNDFSALFQTVAADPDSYLRGDANVFPYAIGRSFYSMSTSALGESNIQFREAWKLYARASPAGEVIEAPGLTITDANQSWVFLNLGFLTDPGDRNLEHHAVKAIEHFASDNRPWALFACQDYLSGESRAVLT
jgi:hypothetical protein